MDQPLIVQTVKKFCGLVGGVIVHHNDIELEVGFLSQGTVHRIHDGLLTVVDGNDY